MGKIKGIGCAAAAGTQDSKSGKGERRPETESLQKNRTLKDQPPYRYPKLPKGERDEVHRLKQGPKRHCIVYPGASQRKNIENYNF